MLHNKYPVNCPRHSQSKVGVVTVTYNGAQIIDGFLKSLIPQTHSNFVLYLVDNASADNTLEHVSKYIDPRIVLVANRTNNGVAQGNNQGIQAALDNGCELILLINNDTEFGPELIDTLITEKLRNHCSMVAPKIYFYEDPSRIWYAGGFFSRRRAYMSGHYGLHEIDNGQYDHLNKVEYAPTCCLLIDKEVFSSVGMMNEKYFVYVDDQDFCYRALKMGKTLFFAASAKLYHKESHSTGGVTSKFGARYATRNQVYFLRMNFSIPMRWFWIIVFQGYIVFWLLNGRDAPAIHRIKQRAFFEGLFL